MLLQWTVWHNAMQPQAMPACSSGARCYVHAGEPGSRLKDCAASADLSLLLFCLYDSSVAVLDVAASSVKLTLQAWPVLRPWHASSAIVDPLQMAGSTAQWNHHGQAALAGLLGFSSTGRQLPQLITACSAGARQQKRLSRAHGRRQCCSHRCLWGCRSHGVQGPHCACVGAGARHLPACTERCSPCCALDSLRDGVALSGLRSACDQLLSRQPARHQCQAGLVPGACYLQAACCLPSDLLLTLLVSCPAACRPAAPEV